MDFEEIGLRIKKCRKDRKLTQESFAELVDVSPHYIYEIERGSKTMSLYTLDSIASALEVSTDYLLYGIFTHYENDVPHKPDKLEVLIETIPTRKRRAVANIIKAILPYIR